MLSCTHGVLVSGRALVFVSVSLCIRLRLPVCGLALVLALDLTLYLLDFTVCGVELVCFALRYFIIL